MRLSQLADLAFVDLESVYHLPNQYFGISTPKRQRENNEWMLPPALVEIPRPLSEIPIYGSAFRRNVSVQGACFLIDGFYLLNPTVTFVPIYDPFDDHAYDDGYLEAQMQGMEEDHSDVCRGVQDTDEAHSNPGMRLSVDPCYSGRPPSMLDIVDLQHQDSTLIDHSQVETPSRTEPVDKTLLSIFLLRHFAEVVGQWFVLLDLSSESI